jgi:hypothetical protein
MDERPLPNAGAIADPTDELGLRAAYLAHVERMRQLLENPDQAGFEALFEVEEALALDASTKLLALPDLSDTARRSLEKNPIPERVGTPH